MIRYTRIFLLCLTIQCIALHVHGLPGHQDAKLFIHFDKTIYSNNEVAWFTGYLLNASSEEIVKHEVLSVALIRDADSTVIKQDKYLIEKGLALGCMLLPDSIAPGSYHFLATTNRVSKGIPDVFFQQSIIIKTDLPPAFTARIKLMDEKTTTQIHQVLLAVTTNDARFLPKPLDVSYRYGNLYRKTKTNVSGELLLSVKEQPDLKDPNLYAKINYGKDSSFVNIPLPVSVKRAYVKFYPEGGYLADQLPAVVAWEVRDQHSAMVTLKAELYEDNRIIDTIETDPYGIGRFQLIPKKECTYRVKLLHSAFADSIYPLPNILDHGLSIAISNAAATDTLRATLRTNTQQKVLITISDRAHAYPAIELIVNHTGRKIKLPMSELPTGLHTLTVSDSLGRPLAERMFFARYDPMQRMDLSTDQLVYNQRQKVTLKLNMTGLDTTGLVSIACVQDNRISNRLQTDIGTYNYLSSELSNLPISMNERAFSDLHYVEDILLTRGWRKYSWQENSEKQYDSLSFKLAVKWSGKKLKKPVPVNYIRDNDVGVLVTDNSGSLTIANPILLSPYGRKMILFLAGNYDPANTIEIHDPYTANNKLYSKFIAPELSAIPSSVQNNRVLTLNNNEKVNRLQEVVIKVVDPSIVPESFRIRGVNPCGDYACKNSIINCRNHFGSLQNTQPIVGNIYTLDMGIKGPYIGCGIIDRTKSFKLDTIDPIYTQKEFYVNDFSDPEDTAIVSTLYWNHATVLTPRTQEITFYTSDITGKFRVVVQGISNSDVLFGQYYFEVKAK